MSAFISLTLPNLLPSVSPPLHFSVHRFIVPSPLLHLKYKRPFDSFCKQTDVISLSFLFFLSCPTCLYSSHMHMTKHTHRLIENARTAAEHTRIGSFICGQIDRDYSQSDLPVQQVFCWLTWWRTVPLLSSTLPLFCSPSRCVGCCLLAPHCVTLRMYL